MVAVEDVQRLMVGVVLLLIGLLIFSKAFAEPECDEMARKSAEQCAAAISQAAYLPVSSGEPADAQHDRYVTCLVRFCQPTKGDVFGNIWASITGAAGANVPMYQMFYEHFPEGQWYDMWTESYPWSGSSIAALIFGVGGMKIGVKYVGFLAKGGFFRWPVKIITKTARGAVKASMALFRRAEAKFAGFARRAAVSKIAEKLSGLATEKELSAWVKTRAPGWYKRLYAAGKAAEFEGNKNYRQALKELLGANPKRPIFDKEGKLAANWKNADDLRAVNYWLATLTREDEKAIRQALGIPSQKFGLWKQSIQILGKNVYKTADEKVVRKLTKKFPTMADAAKTILDMAKRPDRGTKNLKVDFRKAWRQWVAKEKALEPTETKATFERLFAYCRRKPEGCEKFYEKVYKKSFKGDAVGILKAQNDLSRTLRKNDWIIIPPKGTGLHKVSSAAEALDKTVQNAKVGRVVKAYNPAVGAFRSVDVGDAAFRDTYMKPGGWAALGADDPLIRDAIKEEGRTFGLSETSVIKRFEEGGLYSKATSFRPAAVISGKEFGKWSQLPLDMRKSWIAANPGLTQAEARKMWAVAHGGWHNAIFGEGLIGRAGADTGMRVQYMNNYLLRAAPTELQDAVTRTSITEAELTSGLLAGKISNSPIWQSIKAGGAYLKNNPYIGRMVMMDVGRFKWNFWYGAGATQEYENRLTENLETYGNLVYVRAGGDIEMIPLDPQVAEAGGVKLWRPKDKGGAFPFMMQTIMLDWSIKENPRFYTVSPAFGWLKVWRGPDAVYATSQKCELADSTSNYFYADNSLIWGTSGASPFWEVTGAAAAAGIGCAVLGPAAVRTCIGGFGLAADFALFGLHAYTDAPNPKLLTPTQAEQRGEKYFLQENRTLGINEWFPPNSWGYWNYYAAADLCDVMTTFINPGGTKWVKKIKAALPDLCMAPYVIGEQMVAWPSLGALKQELNKEQIQEKQAKCVWGVE